MNQLKNNVILTIYTIILGLIAGIIIWSFIRVMNLGIYFLWEYLPTVINFSYYSIVVCLIGGLLTGLWKNNFGDYPEELQLVIKKVKTNHRYPYNNLFSSIVSSLLPLIFGASIGPEAGLTGVIASLFTWISEKIKIFNVQLEELTSIGITTALGTIFLSPIFGFVEPMENEKDAKLPSISKNILYFVAILSSFGVFLLLNNITILHSGLHQIGTASLMNLNYFHILLLIIVGIILAYFYFICENMIKVVFDKLNSNCIIKGVLGGLILGIIGMILPLSMFSGEEQIYLLLGNGAEIGVAILILTSLIKIVLTRICIESGLKGGHFFPIIFSATTMGYAISIILGMDPVIAMSIVTTSFMVYILKKPIAVIMLLMVIFPLNLIPLMVFSAIISYLLKKPKFLERVE